MLRMNIRRLRRAFTLTELMVAMALAIGIMWILAESFKMGLDMTRHAHATGSMMTQLDGARAIMARDLLAEHFFPDPNKPNGGVKLSDQRLDQVNTANWYPPTGGFFRIVSPAVDAARFADTDGFAIDTAVNHALHFTSILSPTDKDLYMENVGGVPYTSRAAEIAYYLVDSGLTTSPNGQKLYYLVRRQRLVALSDDEKTSLAGAVADTQVIASNGSQIYTLADVRTPSTPYRAFDLNANTLPGGGSPTQTLSNPHYGEDLLLSNVLSFEVLVDWVPGTVPNCTAWPRNATAQGNSEWPYDSLFYATPTTGNVGLNPMYANQGVFDTWKSEPSPGPYSTWNSFTGSNTYALPLAVRVKGLQITVRVFDPKTKQARQSTWKFSM